MTNEKIVKLAQRWQKRGYKAVPLDAHNKPLISWTSESLPPISQWPPAQRLGLLPGAATLMIAGEFATLATLVPDLSTWLGPAGAANGRAYILCHDPRPADRRPAVTRVQGVQIGGMFRIDHIKWVRPPCSVDVLPACPPSVLAVVHGQEAADELNEKNREKIAIALDRIADADKQDLLRIVNEVVFGLQVQQIPQVEWLRPLRATVADRIKHLPAHRQEEAKKVITKAIKDATKKQDKRIVLPIRPDDLEGMCEVARGALRGLPNLYERLGSVVDVQAGQPRNLAPANVEERLSRVVVFTRGEDKVSCPRTVRDALVAQSGLPPLKAIVTTPILTATGRVVATPGYDEETGYYLHAPVPIVMEKTTNKKDAVIALRRLRSITGEFPWADTESFLSWVACGLTIIGRSLIHGPTPCFLIDANRAKCGKTLLMQLLAEVTCGVQAPSIGYLTDQELDKTLLAYARTAPPLLLIDNVRRKIGDTTLERWATTDTISGRLLGHSQVVSGAWQTVIAITANQTGVVGDMLPRLIVSRLETDTNTPESRTFTQPHLIQWVRDHRAEMLQCFFDIMITYLQANSPLTGGRTKGAYEAWTRVVRDPLLWLTGKDIVRESSDNAIPTNEEDAALEEVVGDLYKMYGSKWFSAAHLWRSQQDPRVNNILKTLGTPDHPTIKDIGYALRILSGIVTAKHKVTRRRSHNTVWQIHKRS